jgi:integrase
MTPRRPGAVALRRAKCIVCRTAPAAFAQVDYCFGCWPGGPVTPPPCLRCGSRTSYYTSGVCRRCHKDGDPGVESCIDCDAWGATRHFDWLCHGCSTWRKNNTSLGTCAICRQVRHLSDWGLLVCRLCYKQASMLRGPEDRLDLIGANRHGQQLFFADMFYRRGQAKPPQPPKPRAAEQDFLPRRHPLCAKPSRRPTATAAVTPATAADTTQRVSAGAERVDGEQLVLFAMRRDLAAHGRTDLHLRTDPVRAAVLERHAVDMAHELGWTPKLLDSTCYGLRIVLGIQDYRGQPVNASDVEMLRDIDLPVWPVMRVLDAAGALIEDRTPALDRWFAQQIDSLPTAMISELRQWYEVMKHGSPTPPRRRPRSEVTIKLHLRWALPILRTWAAAGHTSLREITREHVLDALPPSGNPRSTAGQGLKSICRLLKGRKVLFTDPTSRVKVGYHESKQPLPVNLQPLRAALHSNDLAQAALVALTAFHGLRAGQLQRLQLADLRDGRLHIDGRVIVLAQPVRDRIRAWLDLRQQRWPETANPHLFVTKHTARRTEPCSRRWIWLTIGPDLSIAAIREDRILDEARATEGDVRRLADLFGLSIQAGTRYTSTIEYPDLSSKSHP